MDDTQRITDVLSAALEAAESVSFPDVDEIDFDGIDQQIFSTRFSSVGVAATLFGEKGLRVSTKSIPYLIFPTVEDLLASARQDTFSQRILVLQFWGHRIVEWDPKCVPPSRGLPNEFPYFFSNALGYWELHRFLTSMPMSTFGGGKLVDAWSSKSIIAYHSSTARELVALSSEQGLLKIGYPLGTPMTSPATDLRLACTELRVRCESLEFCSFFREALYLFLPQHPQDERLPFLYQELSVVIETALRDYDLFLRKFSFEGLKVGFRKERDGYFIALREVYKSMMTQVLGLPLSLAASVAAVWSVRENSALVYAVMLAYQVYSGLVFFSSMQIRGDNIQVEDDLRHDLDALVPAGASFPQEVQYEANKVLRRVAALKLALLVVRSGIALIALFLVYVSCSLLHGSSLWFVLGSMLWLAIHGSAHFLGSATDRKNMKEAI